MKVFYIIGWFMRQHKRSWESSWGILKKISMNFKTLKVKDRATVGLRLSMRAKLGLQTFLGRHVCCLNRDCLLLGHHEKTAHKFPEDFWREYAGVTNSEKAKNDR